MKILLPLLLATLLLALPAGAQQDETRHDEPRQDEPRPTHYVGVATCASALCHGSTVPRDAFDVLQNEYYTWLEEDPHSRAFEVLSSQRSRAIAANLGYGVAAWEAETCLACHALVVPAQLQARPVEIEDGVSCESCHGPAGGWLAGHHTEGWTRQDSVDAGLVDLTVAEQRAATCLGCHLGDGDRTVDHELIAAGHPQLPFELDNYAAAMPPHWPPAAAVGDRALRRRLLDNRGAGAWAVGQAVALRHGLEEIARTADTGGWPDFAVQRCTDCHHSLREERWRRQAGRRGGDPGLPRWSPARWVVLRHLVAAFSPTALPEVERRVDDLADATARLDTPATEVAARARRAAAALDGVTGTLGEVRWEPQRVRAVALRIAADRDTVAAADRETAEQVMLALQTLASELLAADPGSPLTGMVAALEDMARALDDPYGHDPQNFAVLMRRFESSLQPGLFMNARSESVQGASAQATRSEERPRRGCATWRE